MKTIECSNLCKTTFNIISISFVEINKRQENFQNIDFEPSLDHIVM